jgi:hypothetical protein
MADEQKLCFVISPIGELGSATRKRADAVLKHVIRPAAESCGYRALRADEIDQPGMITHQIIQHLLDAPLVIADLSERSANVFYEVAIRHVVRKPLVQMIEVTDPIPFDLSVSRMIKLDHKDLDSADEARIALIAQIKAVENNPSLVDNPISTAIDLSQLKATGKPADVQLAELIQGLRHDIGNEFASLQAVIVSALNQQSTGADLRSLILGSGTVTNPVRGTPVPRGSKLRRTILGGAEPPNTRSTGDDP